VQLVQITRYPAKSLQGVLMAGAGKIVTTGGPVSIGDEVCVE